MKILAHRGYSAKYPENTMKAFEEAYKADFDGIETDVQMSRDGELVLIHDEKIDRTSQGKGYVKDYTLEELKKINFNNKIDGFYPIPTLKELLVWIKDKDMLLNIEIKTDKIQYANIEKKVLELVENIGVQDKVIYSSFCLESLLKIRQMNPTVYIGYLMEYGYQKRIKKLLEKNIRAIHPRYTFLNKKTISQLKKEGLFIATWTVPHFKKYERLKDLGVDIIIANENLREVRI